MAFLVGVAAVPLFGQGAPPDQANPLAEFAVKDNINRPDFPVALTDVAASAKAFIDYVVASNAFGATFRNLLKSAENGRVDEQSGAPTTAGGATSAAEKAGLTGLVTAALETGALTQTLDQNLFTLRGNAEGLFRFLSGQEVLPQCLDATDTSCDPSPLNNLELTASFAVSKSNTQTVTGQSVDGGATLTALISSPNRQFSSATARYAIINSRDLRSKTYRDAWNAWFSQNRTALEQASSDVLSAEDAIFNQIQSQDINGKTVSPNDSLYSTWRKGANDALLEVMPRTEAAVSAVLKQQLDLLITQMQKAHPDFQDKIVAARNAYNRYYANTIAGFELGNQPMLTLEASYQEPPLETKFVNTQLIFGWSPKGNGTTNHGTVTLNAEGPFTRRHSHRARPEIPVGGEMHRSHFNSIGQSTARRCLP